MRKYSGLQRLLAILLSAALILGNMAGISLDVQAEEATGPILSKITDPATVNNWMKYFSSSSTDNAGGVWTDKSVFASVQDYLDATDETENTATENDLALLDTNNFLVALSAIASTKSIEGYSNIPTDTILVLDVSGSMANSGSDDEMVNAANLAIDTLLNLNEHNRVGVVLYSSTSATMLSLDRYTAGDTYTSTTYVENPDWYPGSWEDRYIVGDSTTYQEYLKFSNHTISIGDNLKDSAGDPVSGNSRNVTGGTYIQSGLSRAMDIFLDAETKITGDVVQAGTIRMPVTVLMSDGDPTYGTTAYAAVGDREFGNGSASSNELGYVTQMTAAYLKAKVEEHYGRSSLFYTLGLGVGSGSVAESVLDPESSNSAISGYWDEFLADGTADWTEGSGRNEVTRTVSRSGNDTITLEEYAAYEHYVTEYFPASNASDLNAAFQSIVDAVTLQSMYYPTNIKGTDFDNSGYIEFRDYIGEGMEVKAVKGVQWGETLHTGKDFAHTVKYGMGTEEAPTEEGNELLGAVMDRLGITDVQMARDLIAAAWNAGQLAYNDENPNNVTYSNYIGWYAAQDGSYLGFWNGSEDYSDAPTGAFQTVKCYFTLGDVGDGHRATDMLYASIQVRTTISTGEQIVYGRLPASLIPLIQYNVSLNAANPLDATEIAMTVTETTPSRLIFEVGLSSDVDINALTPGTHEFYTNQWEGEVAVGEDPSTAHNTFVSFQPSSENERYVYHEDMPVYVKDGDRYVRYTGSTAPTGSDYYRAYQIYTATGNGDEAEITVRYEAIPAEALTADTVEQVDGGWVVKKGTIYRYTVRDEVEKTENATGTLGHSEHPLVHLSPEYHLDAVLGNNGKLTIVITPPKKVLDNAGNDIDGETVMIGDVLTYEITAYNYEDSDADITITDTVPAGTELVEGSITGGGVIDPATGVITWTADGVPSGDSVTVSFQVTVTDAAVEEINNTAYINVGNNPTYVTNTTTNPPVGKTSASDNYTIEGEIQVGDVITYTIHYHNDDSATAVVTVSDRIPAGTIYVDGSASYSGTEYLTLTEDADGNVTDLTWVLPGVPAGASGSVTFQVYVGPDAISPVENTATIKIGDNAPTISTNTVEDDLAYGDLILTKTVATGNAPGSPDKYFTLELYSGVEGVASLNGTFAVTGSSKVTEVTFVDGYASLEIKGGETITIVDLPAGVTVSVYEQHADGYTATYSVDAQRIIADAAVQIDVTNTYNVTATSVILEGTKTLVGKTLEENEFSFLVYENYGTASQVIVSTGENTADGTIIFKPITYAEAGTHIYTVVEVNSGEGGITYDETVYTVTVTVTDNGAGQLTASVTYPDGGVKFNNSYKAASTGVTLEGSKSLTGRDLRDNEFSFVVYENYGTDEQIIVTTGENLADGTIVFKPITYTEAGIHTYTIVEVNSGLKGVTYDTTVFTVQVSVVDNGEGQLIATVTYPDGGVVFNNSYSPAPTSVTLDGTKNLTGRDLKDGEFSFLVYEGTTLVTTGENLADGTIVFKPITYTEAGTHTYTVYEVVSTAGGVTYDDAVYTVTVTVTDNGLGDLVAVVSYPDSGIVFNNEYNTETTSVTLEGSKSLIGRPMADNEFSFIVTDENGDVVSTGLSKAGGNIVFTPISYAAAGEFTYTISEVEGHLEGVTYSDQTFRVKVLVEDDGNGNLVATVTYLDGSVAFENTYTPDPVIITPEGTKELLGREMGDNEFSFVLTDEDGNVVSTGLSKKDGTIVFTPITYTAADLGDHTYTVSEVEGHLGGVSYTDATFQITVTVTHNTETGKLETTVTYPADGVKFVNTYTADSTSYTPVGTKTLTGRDMDDNEFSFIVTDSEGNVVSTGLSKKDGTIVFTPINYTAVGEYTYTVSEVVGYLGGVEYDKTVFTFTVEVTDDGNGNLVATAAYPEAIAFANIYTSTPVDVNLNAFKTLSGKLLAAGEFSFVLRDSEGNEVETATNMADGTVSFDTLTFDKVGTYTYTISEQAGTDSRYTYDARVYTVTIQVLDNGSGNLYASVTYHIGTAEVGAVAFHNTYTPAAITLDLNDKIDFTKTVEDTAESGYSPAGFSFEVYDWSGTLVASGISDENGYIDLEEDLTFTLAGEYRYRVIETVSDAAGITIDSTVWVVHVTVTYDNTTGQLSVSHVHAHELGAETQATDVEGQNETTDVEFVNIYDPEDETLEIKVNKNLTGRDLKAGEFTFQLFEGAKLITQATNDKDGNVTFTVAYDKVGIYTYTVREVKGDLGGVTYDENGYEIVVNVTDEGGKLKAEVTSEAVTFENTYIARPVRVSLEAAKALTGRDLDDEEFTFVLTDADGNEIEAMNLADGTVTFAGIEYTETGTYTYTITEKQESLGGVTYSDLVYTATVTVTDDGIGHLIADVSYALDGQSVEIPVFTNVYEAAPVTVKLGATKTLTGRDLIDGEFTFILTDADGNEIEATNTAGGTVTFAEIEYTETGVYTYTLTEEVGTKGGVTYDEARYEVVVAVTDNQEGQLVAVVTVDGTPVSIENGAYDLATFNNSYAAAEVEVQLEAVKNLTGRDLIDGEFTFELKGEDQTYTATNDADGKISFTICYTEVGTYTYTLSEAAGTLGGVTYDETEYTVTVYVTDNKNGQLEATVVVGEASITADENGIYTLATFNNSYNAASVEAELEASKNLIGRDLADGEFTFLLTDEAGDAITATNTSKGKIVFELTFDAVGTYSFVMSEVKGNAEHVTYDAADYDVVVVVADDGEGSLYVASVTVDGAESELATDIEFVNAYKIPENPKTGDESGLMLSAMLMLGCVTALAALLLGKKKEWFA